MIKWNPLNLLQRIWLLFEHDIFYFFWGGGWRGALLTVMPERTSFLLQTDKITLISAIKILLFRSVAV